MAPERIEVPLPLPLRTANAWLFRGDRPALIDCGIGTNEAYALVVAHLTGASLDIVATHAHVDHVGNAQRLRREFGATLHAHERDRSAIEHAVSGADARYQAFGAALQAHGVPREAALAMRGRGEWLDTMMEDAAVSPLQDGTRIQLGHTEARVHAAPGHTPGSILVATEDNDLATGDTLLRHITSNAIELTDSDRGRYATYLQTLDGMRRFVGMRALPGHHDAFEVTDAVLDEHLAKHSERSRRVLDHLDRPRTAWNLVPLVFPKLAADQAFLGVCEVVGHLHALEAEGKVVWVDEGVRRFRRA